MLRRWSQDRRSTPALFMTMWLPCWVGSLLMGPCPGLGMSEKKDAVGLILLECPWLSEIIVTQKECLAYIQDFKCRITKGGHRRKERAGWSGKRFFCRGGDVGRDSSDSHYSRLRNVLFIHRLGVAQEAANGSFPRNSCWAISSFL